MEATFSSPRSESLPRARIIRRRAVFDRTRQLGRRVTNRWMTLSVLPVDAGANETATVAFLTPKRLGPATVRNKLRRRMREIFRKNLAAETTDTYLIWIARPPAVDLNFIQLREKMAELMARKG